MGRRHAGAARRPRPICLLQTAGRPPELAVQELERLFAIDPGAVEVAEQLRRLRAR